MYAAVVKLLNDLTPLRDLEIVVLKAHLMMEVLLRSLLAQRVDLPLEGLPALQFRSLAILALGGPGRRQLKKDVLRLNELRNDLAHEIIETEYSGQMWQFVKRWRRARGKRRLRWVELAKLRFVRISLQILAEMVKALTQEQREQVLAQAPEYVRVLFENPRINWSQLKIPDTPVWDETLPEITLSIELTAAERALVQFSKIRERALDHVVVRRKLRKISDDDFKQVAASDEEARTAARALFALASDWRDKRLGTQFEQQYSVLREALKRIQGIAKASGAA